MTFFDFGVPYLYTYMYGTWFSLSSSKLLPGFHSTFTSTKISFTIFILHIKTFYSPLVSGKMLLSLSVGLLFASCEIHFFKLIQFGKKVFILPFDSCDFPSIERSDRTFGLKYDYRIFIGIIWLSSVSHIKRRLTFEVPCWQTCLFNRIIGF